MLVLIIFFIVFYSYNTAAGFQYFLELAFEWTINKKLSHCTCLPFQIRQDALFEYKFVNIFVSHMVCLFNLVIRPMSFFLNKYLLLFRAK